MTDHPAQRPQPMAIAVQAGKTYWWCACGRSRSQPFCDGSHKGTPHAPVEFRATRDEWLWFCVCKRTRNAPLCDGAHKNSTE